MLKRLLALLAMAAALTPALGADPDPCALLTPSEIASALGATPSAGSPDGPTVDHKLEARSWTCQQQAGSAQLFVSLIEFTTADGASRGMAAMLREAAQASSPSGIALTPAPDPGEQAAWGASPEGALWVALQGRHIFSVLLAGELRDTQRLREPLKELTTTGLRRLR